MTGAELRSLDLLETGPIRQHEHERRACEALEQELEQLARRGVRPVDVLDRDERRPPRRHGEQELPKAREYLLLALLVRHADSCRRLAQTQERAEQDDVFLVDAELCGPRLELVQVVRPAADDRLHDVEEWAEGALTSALDAHLALGPGGAELGEQSRLADAGLAHDADHVRVSLSDARPEQLEQRQLLTATDERPQFATASLVSAPPTNGSRTKPTAGSSKTQRPSHL